MSQVVQWSELLKLADPSHDSHPLICQMGEKYVALTPQEYNLHSKKNTFWKTYCHKISLKKIIDFSENVIKFGHEKKSILDDLNVDNAFTVDFAFEPFFQRLKEDAEDRIKKAQAPQNIFEILQKMCERARAKQIQAKTQGIWNRIKFYIWTWFYDQSSRLKKPEIIQMPSLDRVVTNLLESGCFTLQGRILLNIRYFEEEIEIPENERIFPDKVGREKFATPRDVKKKWVTQYAEDKYPDVSDKASDYRKRILILCQLWERFIEKKNDMTIPTSSTVPGQPGILLIREA